MFYIFLINYHELKVCKMFGRETNVYATTFA